MGSITPIVIKRHAVQLINQYPTKFTKNFEENKKALAALVSCTKPVRNRLAGCITVLKKRELSKK
jgi:small subunit ribosomal protein S17e